MDFSADILPELTSLVEKKLVKKSQHKILPLDIYNYTSKLQFKNKWTPLVSIYCRGLVIHRHTNEIISLPLSKFFNHIEETPSFLPTRPSLTVPLESPYLISEKMDGSLGMWFWFEENKDWIMMTRGSFHSNQAGFGDEIAREKGLHLPGKCEKGKTYCFEIIHPKNRILIDYGSRRELILLAIIDSKTGVDIPTPLLPSIAEKLGISAVPFWMSDDEGSPATLEGWLTKDVLGKEGYVVRFDSGTGSRMKLKFPNYISQVQTSQSFSKIGVLGWLLRNPDKAVGDGDGIEGIADEFFEEIKEVERRWKEARGEARDVLDRAVVNFRGRQVAGIKEAQWVELRLPKGTLRDLACKYMEVSKVLKNEVLAIAKEFELAWAENVLRKEYTATKGVS